MANYPLLFGHFSSSDALQKCVSQNTISFSLDLVIKRAHKRTIASPLFFKAKAHGIRGIGTLLLFVKNLAVQQILRAGSRESLSAFTLFYQRDVTHRSWTPSPLALWCLLNRSCRLWNWICWCCSLWFMSTQFSWLGRETWACIMHCPFWHSFPSLSAKTSCSEPCNTST